MEGLLVLTCVATINTQVPEVKALWDARLWTAVAPHGTCKGDDIAETTKEAGAKSAGIWVSLPN